MGKRDKRRKEKLERGSTPSRSNTNITVTDADVTYYNVQPPPSRTSRSTHSNDVSNAANRSNTAPDSNFTPAPPVPSGGGGGGGGGAAAVLSSSSSSSSSSTTSSDTESLGPAQLALVPRPPQFNPYMMGFPPGQGGAGGYYGGGPYGMQMGGYGSPMGGVGMGHPAMMGGGGQLMLPPPQGGGGGHGGGGGGMSGAVMPAGGMGMGMGGMGGMGPPARYLPQDEQYEADRMAMEKYHPHSHHNTMIMEHPSLRQFVIFMAVMFVLALVALVVIAIYFGRTAETSWNI